MRSVFAGVAAAAFIVALSAPAFAKTETVTGKIVDESCYKMDKSNTGNDHKMPNGDTKECATACAKMGRPLALLTSEGKVYEISGALAADKNAKLIPHISHTVSITGDVMDHGDKMMIAADAGSLKMISR